MSIIMVSGGRRLSGKIRVGGAKNAVLPMMAACILSGGVNVICDAPAITDIADMSSILEKLGCKVSRDSGGIVIDSSSADSWDMPDALSKRIRSSIFLLGPLIGRFRKACVTYPGGCDIGLRPIDLHLKGLRTLGVKITEAHGRINCDGTNLRGGYVYLDFPSVGATENVMMAAVLAKGRTVIHNAAREPEILDLQRFINNIGGHIRGAGTDKIVIDGVESLTGGAYSPIPDRIVAGTLMAACAATRGNIVIENAPSDYLCSAIDKLRAAGCEIDIYENELSMSADCRLAPFDISTQSYPGFPTDLQAQFMALMCTIDGASMIVENLFENRFGHVSQLSRMGADIFVNNRLAVVKGSRLTGAKVKACDLRGGAALIIAGLAAEGITKVCDCYLIDRGYERIEEMLTSLNCDVSRCEEEI